MKHTNKFIYSLLLIITVFSLISCSEKKRLVRTNENKLIVKHSDFSEVMALSMEGKTEKIYKINNKSLTQGKVISKVTNINYNISKNISVYNCFNSNGNNLTGNSLIINNDSKNYEIKKSFSYMNTKLSTFGSKLALRSFSKDSLSSAEGLSIYNTANGEKIDFDKDVLVSGSMYSWQDDDNLLYYGIAKGETNFGKIYNYNFKSHLKTVKYDNFNDYCTSFISLNNGDIIYLESGSDTSKLKYYDAKGKTNSLVTLDIESIENYSINNNTLYFIGKDTNTSEYNLYSISENDKKLNRLTYDFPSNVDKNGGMALDEAGNIYFCGNNNNQTKNDIYMYDKVNNSTNLLTKSSGDYHIVCNGV